MDAISNSPNNIEKDRPLKVLLFAPSSSLYGSDRRLLELVTELIHDHGASCIVCLPGNGPLVQRLQEVGAGTILGNYHWWCALPGREVDEDMIQTSFSASLDWLVKELPALEKFAPDVVVSCTIVFPWGAIAAALLNRAHLWMVTEFGELDHALKFYLPFSEVIAFILDSSNRVVTSSNDLRDTLFGSSNTEKVETIYKYIPPPRTDLLDAGQFIFKYPHTIKLAVVGNIIESKGQEDAVLAAVDLIRGLGREVELALIGTAEPTYLDRLKKIVKSASLGNRVHFLPFQDNVAPFVRQADIALVCSRREGFSSVAIEAMLLNKAVVATNTGGTPEIIQDGRTGLLYEPGNIPQLVEQIVRLMDQPALRADITERALKFVQDTYTRERFGGRHYELLTAIRQADNPLNAPAQKFIRRLFVTLLTKKEQTVQHLPAQAAGLGGAGRGHARKAPRFLRRVFTFLAHPDTGRGRFLRKMYRIVAGKSR